MSRFEGLLCHIHAMRGRDSATLVFPLACLVVAVVSLTPSKTDVVVCFRMLGSGEVNSSMRMLIRKLELRRDAALEPKGNMADNALDCKYGVALSCEGIRMRTETPLPEILPMTVWLAQMRDDRLDEPGRFVTGSKA